MLCGLAIAGTGVRERSDGLRQVLDGMCAGASVRKGSGRVGCVRAQQPRRVPAGVTPSVDCGRGVCVCVWPPSIAASGSERAVLAR